MLSAFWWQYHDGLRPCSLCWVQRGEVLLLLAGFALYRRVPRFGSGLALGAALAGVATALLQLSEVHGTPPVGLSVCAITASGAPSCALAGSHRIFGVTLVEWSLAGFAFWSALASTTLVLRWRRRGGAFLRHD